ncbi:hypothetical protein CAPTEDRAFT_178222 [Capitella teleta]|uniref:Glutamate receptor n=1 Tax=Capitella teleta TaxID=283909 RepID=R7TIS1_CAPTE|nr:hypothetical protein CAPTEDRAFT_178222 [Capitella teleta]|eukprot:ELT93728.1 hypothetical protein CAPTEDRAFT_178222 [Capitella teleta]
MFDQDQRTMDFQAGYQMAIHLNNEIRNRVRVRSQSIRLDLDDPYSVGSAFCSLMSSGSLAVLSSHTMNTLSTLQSYSSTFKMPLISLNMPIEGEDTPSYQMYMTPHYIRAFLDVIHEHYGWNKVYYMYNTRAGLENYQQLLNLIRGFELDIRLIMLRVEDADDALNLLQKMDARVKEDKQIIMDLPTQECKYFLIERGLQEFTIPQIFANGGMNVTGFKLVNFQNYDVRNFLKNWQKEDPKAWIGLDKEKFAHEVALAADAIHGVALALKRLQNSQPREFSRTLRDGKLFINGSLGIDCEAKTVAPWSYGDAVMNQLKAVKFRGLTGNVEFDAKGYRDNFSLGILEVTMQRGIAEVGNWSSSSNSPLTIHRNPILIRPRTTVKKKNDSYIVSSILASSILTKPYLTLKKGHEYLEGNDKYEGYCADLAKLIAEEINIKYKIVPVADKKYGGLNENGTWDGMVGELVRHESDLAIAPLTITSVRERVVEFSKPFMSLGISIMIKKNEKTSPGVFSFMYPLSYEIWMCVIFAYIGVSVVLFLVSRFSPYEWHIEDNTDGPTVTNNFTIFNSLWFSLGAFMQQGCDIEPRSMSGRIVGSVWWFFTLIVISSYTANLAAFLTVSRMQSPIESADDLAKQTEIKYGTLSGGSTEGFFKNSEIAVYEKMWAFMSADPSNSVSTNEEGVARVRRSRGRYAFLMESTTNDYINQRKPCDTMQQDATNSLKLPNVAGIFYILIAGLVLALAIAFLEFTYKSRAEAQRRKTSFSNALRSKAKLSLTGKPERQSTAYAYAPAAQLISLDGYAETNTHTEV